ncbi:MAG TPA: glycosyltransferase family 4 protein, partial [Patescibacteria group bacterium]|nr:glycosyltransferase family 4 protein [Patescibacteria group bacterium]
MKFKPSIKIGFILDGGLEKPDGVQQYILGLGQYFKSIGNEVRYLIAGPYPKEMSDVISLSRSWQVNSNGNQLTIPFPAKSKAIKEYLLQEKFDVLHVQTPYSPLMGGKVVLRADKSTAVIGTYHIVPNSRFLSVGNWLLGKYCIKSLKRIDRMISVSEAAKFIAKRDFSIDSVIIPNLVDFNKYNSASKNRNTNSLTILFLGRLVPRKGCLVLLKAIKRLSEKENIPKFNVVIAGSGPLEAKLKNYVKEN